MTLSVGICSPFVASGELSFGQPCCDMSKSSSSNLISSNGTSKSSNVSIHTQAKETQNAEPPSAKNANKDCARHAVNALVAPLFGKGATKDEISEYINKYKDDPARQAWVIGYIIDRSVNGWGTNETGLKAAIYAINKENIAMVNKFLQENRGMTIKEQIADELNDEEAKDLYRHINQFKK